MMSITAFGNCRLPAFAFSRSLRWIVHTPSSMSSQRMVTTLSLRCAVSSATLRKAPKVPSAAFHSALISSSVRMRLRLRPSPLLRCMPFTTGLT